MQRAAIPGAGVIPLFLMLAFGLDVSCGSSDANTGTNTSTNYCPPGDTRECVGPGACRGGQMCQPNSTWGSCDCGGQGTGGATSVTGTGGVNAATGGIPQSTGGTATGGTSADASAERCDFVPECAGVADKCIYKTLSCNNTDPFKPESIGTFSCGLYQGWIYPKWKRTVVEFYQDGGTLSTGDSGISYAAGRFVYEDPSICPLCPGGIQTLSDQDLLVSTVAQIAHSDYLTYCGSIW